MAAIRGFLHGIVATLGNEIRVYFEPVTIVIKKLFTAGSINRRASDKVLLKDQSYQLLRESYIKLRISSNRMRREVKTIDLTKAAYEKEIVSCKKIYELNKIKLRYEESYERLFCTPVISITNTIREEMIAYAKNIHGVDEDFRVLVKLVFRKDEVEITNSEFKNSVWDTHTWHHSIKRRPVYYKEKTHKIKDNSAIEALMLKKIGSFVCNDLQSINNYGFEYFSHNGQWKDIYNSKILTKIQSRKENVIFGFLSIDSMNVSGANLFDDHPGSIPLNLALSESESISLLCGQLELFLTEMKCAFEKKKLEIEQQQPESANNQRITREELETIKEDFILEVDEEVGGSKPLFNTSENIGNLATALANRKTRHAGSTLKISA